MTRYTLLSEIGRGGMGVVWKARDEETGSIVAIKLMREGYADDPDYIQRFEREAELAQRIDSIHVVKVLDYGLRDGVPFLALEYVEGPSVYEALTKHGPYTWAETKATLAQLAQGLADANAAGVIHRDIKPSNVLIALDGTAKLTDFGIARGLNFTRITATATIVGTPAYLAPEGPKDARSDLYSLGVIGYELLTGATPFKGTSYQEIVIAHIREAPDLSVLPEEARPLIGWLLAKDPAERPARASALLPVLYGAAGVPETVSVANSASLDSQAGPIPKEGPSAASAGIENAETVALASVSPAFATRLAARPDVKVSQVASPPVSRADELPTAADDSRRGHRRRVGVALLVGGLLVAFVAAMALGGSLADGPHSTPSASGQIVAVVPSPDFPATAGGTNSGLIQPGVAGYDVASPSGSVLSSQVPDSMAPPTPTAHGSAAVPPLGQSSTPAPTRAPTPTPTLVPTPTPTPTAVPDPNPDWVVSTDVTQSTDGVAHGSGSPFVPSRTYHNFTVQAGAYVSAGGSTLVLSATGTVTVAGVITMDGHGYAGGHTDHIYQGDSYTGAGTGSPNANGGGGGGGWQEECGGGGGGYGTAGETGHSITLCSIPAAGGSTYGDASLTNLYAGSGGGASNNTMGHPWAAGGAGGGIIKITAGAIIVTGSISANGQAGNSAFQYGPEYCGSGGGSGGSILLVAGSLTGSARVTVAGGKGGYGSNPNGDISGGAGGQGRFRFVHA
jgi:serine/threonine protein kinase